MRYIRKNSKAGRPSLDGEMPCQRLTFTIPWELANEFKELAKHYNTNMSEMIREFIEKSVNEVK